jgi:hypothetical protein
LIRIYHLIFFKIKKTNKDNYCNCHEKNHKAEKKDGENSGIPGLFGVKYFFKKNSFFGKKIFEK